VGELDHQIFVGVAQHVGADGGVAEPDLREPLDQILQQLVGELLLVAPVCRSKDTKQRVRIGPLDLLHGLLQSGADVGRNFPYAVPVTAFSKHESMHLWKQGGVGYAVNLASLSHSLVPDVGDVFEKEQGKDVALPIRAIDG